MGCPGRLVRLVSCPGASHQRLASVVRHKRGASSTSNPSRTSLNLDCHAVHGAVAHEAVRSNDETGTCRTPQKATKRGAEACASLKAKQLWRDPQPRPTVAQPRRR